MNKLQSLIEDIEFLSKPLKWLKNKTISRYRSNLRRKYIKQNGKEFLEQLDKAFKELGLRYWLDFGTLLGAVREKDFIKNDVDIDISMYLDDFSEDIEKSLNKYGFTKLKEIVLDDGKMGRTEAYTYKGVTADIFYYRKDGDKIVCYNFLSKKGWGKRKTISELGGLIASEVTFTDTGLKPIEFLGMEFLAPADTDLHLRENYGDDYMVPNPNFKEDDEKNTRTLEIVGEIKLYNFEKIYV